MKKKLNLIVPHRDRQSHLKRFIPSVEKYLDDNDIPFSIYIIDQDNKKPFNRGKLLNIGFDISKDDGDYFCFHDVDLIPDEVDYSYPEYPVHLATNLSKDDFKEGWEYYFGGVTMFNKGDFKKINGFSNNYWGWGFEDDDLLRRCVNFGLKVNDVETKVPISYGMGSGYFNGTTSHCDIVFGNKEIRSIFKNDFTIMTTFLPDDVSYDDDISGCVWSIPEFGFNLLFSNRGSVDLILTDINGEKKVCQEVFRLLNRIPIMSIVSYDSKNKNLSFYINGDLVDSIKIDLNKIDDQENMYLGVENPKGFPEKYYFKGQIFEHSVYDRKISKREVNDLFHKRRGRSLTQSFNSYKAKNLCCYYDFNHYNDEMFLDISNNSVTNKNTDVISGVLNEDSYFTKRIIKKLPLRRKSKFLCLFHKTEGWVGKGWKQPETYVNQKYYFDYDNKMEIVLDDGLNNLEYNIENTKPLSKHSTLYKVSFS